MDALYGATTVTELPGTMLVSASSGGEDIRPNATLNATTYTQGDVVGITSGQAGATKVAISANATLGVVGPGGYTNNLPITNAGAFNIGNTARVTLSGGQGVNSDYTQENGSDLRIQNGATLNANLITISGGAVYLVMNPALPANEQTATVNIGGVGNIGFNISGDTILFSIPLEIGNSFVYGTFTVNGNVNWTGGTYCPSADDTSGSGSNVWYVSETLTSAKACIVQPNPQQGNTPPKNTNWLILQAGASAGVLPTVAAGSPLTLGTFSINNIIQWKLTSGN